MDGFGAGLLRQLEDPVAAQVGLDSRSRARRQASSASSTCGAPRSASEKTATVRIPSSRQARRTRRAISPRFAMRILRNTTIQGTESREAAIGRKKKPSRGARAFWLGRCVTYFMTTPPAAFSLAFSSLALRAPMAFCTQSCACARSALRAASSPQSVSALRRYCRFRYCMASS